MDDSRSWRIAEAIADGTWIRDPADGGDGLDREFQVLAAIAAVHRGAEPVPATHTWHTLHIRELVGEGGFADVYRAWDPRLERDVALKLLRDAGSDSAPTAYLIDEARLLARVRHPNVATVYGADIAGGRAGVWMELLDGHSLEAIVETAGPVAPARAVEIGLAICSALEAVHAAGIVHGDVKPTNVIVTASGRIVLTDFGAGRDIVHRGASSAAFATPAYAAPELLAGAAPSPSHDLYSLGVLMKRLVSGHAAGVPHGLRDAIDRATAAKAGRRFQTAREFADALRASAGAPRRGAARSIAAIVALAVVTSLLVAYVRETRPRTGVAAGTLSVAARDAYLRGTFERRKRTADALLRSRDEFERAAALAPEHAPAHAAVAQAYLLLGVFGAVPLGDATARADAAARRALELDPSVAAAHTAAGYVLVLQGRVAEGLAEYRRAIELDPRDATARQWYALTIVDQQPDEAIAQILAALALDPFSRAISTDVATIYARAGQIDRAIEHFERTARLFPAFAEVHIQLGTALARRGDLAAAASRLEVAVHRFESSVSAVVELATVYAALGRVADARQMLARLETLSGRQHVNPVMFALVHAALGERDAALRFAKLAVAQRDGWNSWSLNHAAMRQFRDDPQFVAVAQEGDRLMQPAGDD